MRNPSIKLLCVLTVLTSACATARPEKVPEINSAELPALTFTGLKYRNSTFR